MMDNLGVAMNATNIQAYALEKGINFKWSTATQAQKAEIAMQMFFESTQQYAGNFAKESTETISGSFGLLKAATDSFIAGLGNKNADMKNLTGNVVDAFKAVVSNVTPIFKNIASALPQALEAIVPAIGDILPLLLNTITDLTMQIFNMGIKMLPKLIPLAVKGIMTISQALIDNLPALGKAAIEIGKKLFSGIGEAVPWLKPVLGALQEAFGDLFGSLKGDDAKEILTTVAKTASKLLVPAINLAKTAIKTITGVLQKVMPVIAPIIDKVGVMAKKFMEMASAVLPVLGEVFGAVFIGISKIVGPILDGVFTALGGLMDFITGVFTGDWEKAWGGITDFFGGIWEGVKSGFKAFVNFIIRGLNKIPEALNSLSVDIPDWVPGVGGKTLGFKLPTIPEFYKGVSNFSGGAALVGERGPELVNLPRGADVFSNRETGSILSKARDFGDAAMSIVVNITQHISGGVSKQQAAEAAENFEKAVEAAIARIQAKRRRVSFQG